MTADMQQVYTPAQAATYLQVSERTVRRACKEGRLPAGRIGRMWRISRRALDDFLKNGLPS